MIAAMNWQDIASVALTLFFIMDPLGNVPIFHAVTANCDPSRRSRIVARELLIALGILLALSGLADWGLTMVALMLLATTAVSWWRSRPWTRSKRKATSLCRPGSCWIFVAHYPMNQR